MQHTLHRAPGAFWNGELLAIGKVGDDYSVEDAQQAALVCGLNIIAQAKAALDGV